MQSFDIQHRTRIVYGAGKIAMLGQLARELGGRRVLMVSDGGVIKAGHWERARESLQSSGVEVELFDGVLENPTTREVDAGLAVANRFRPDILIGLGGGSSMDCAKGINFLYCCGGRIQDYWGVGKATAEMLPMIAAPTTAGTGSEAQSFALISDADTHVKMACGDPKAACRIALLDPELTVTQPARVTALTGIDALTHALETYVTKKRNPLSLCYSREAWRLISSGFPKVLDEPHNLDARSQMQLGACLAGMAIESSMLGAAHATANPLTAHYGITHGQAVGLMMPHVIRFNGQQYGQWYAELWQDTQVDTCDYRVDHHHRTKVSIESSVQHLADFVEHLVKAAGLHTRLQACGVEHSKLVQLANDASQQWTGTFNPRPLDHSALHGLYESAFR